MINPVEMGMGTLDVAMGRAVAENPGLSDEICRSLSGEAKPITADNVAKAIAAFERTLITPNSPYDRFVKGEKTALDEQQIRGMDSFADLGCTACHSGANFSGPTLPVGTGFFMKFPTFPGSEFDAKYDLVKDDGRFAVTQQEADRHLFRVPTLRNIALTAPYFHTGTVPTLDLAVKVMAKTQLNKDLTDDQAADLVAFLNGLTGEFPQIAMPRLPPTPNMSVIPPLDPHLKK